MIIMGQNYSFFSKNNHISADKRKMQEMISFFQESDFQIINELNCFEEQLAKYFLDMEGDGSQARLRAEASIMEKRLEMRNRYSSFENNLEDYLNHMVTIDKYAGNSFK